MHMIAAGILLEPPATVWEEGPLLAIVARACVASKHTAPSLHQIFILLIELGADSLGDIHTMVRYWRQALLEAATCRAQMEGGGAAGGTPNLPPARVGCDAVLQAFENFQGSNRRLAWEMSLETHLPLELNPAHSDVQMADRGFCRFEQGGFRQLVVDGVFKKSNTTGRSTVGRLAGSPGCDLYLKCRPELPGVELMVRELARALFGQNAAPYAVLARWQRTGVAGVDAGDPVLLSQGVPGRTLHEVLTCAGVAPTEAKETVLARLDPASFSEAAILAMLTMPEDGKPGNYICEELPSGTVRLVCIDNDHSFAPAAAELGLHVHFRVKCILFCLETMHEPIDPSTRSALLDATGGGSKQEVFRPLMCWLEAMSRTCSQNDALYDGSSQSAAALWKQNTVGYFPFLRFKLRLPFIHV
jgi:hypothetical protein